MANQTPTVASKVVSVASLLGLLPPIAWLALMSRPNARQAFIAAPERFDHYPVVFSIALATSLLISLCLLFALAFIAFATLRRHIQTDRPMFFALNAIWAYIGVVALVGKIPGLTLLIRSTFTAPNFGWFVVIATGLPIWEPLLLWYYGTARPASAHWTHADG